MIDKIVLSLLVVFGLSVNAFAEPTGDGLWCSMNYLQGKVSAAPSLHSSGWLSHGSDLDGEAVAKKFTMTGAAHKIMVAKTLENKWNVKVVDAAGKELGTMAFPETGTMRGVFNIKAWAPESEDPAQYDVLEVSCEYTSFAG